MCGREAGHSISGCAPGTMLDRMSQVRVSAMGDARFGCIERVGDYAIREQSPDEIQKTTQLPFDLCGINPYGSFRCIRRFLAELDGKPVGEGWVMASRHNPWGELGHYGMFAEEHKRKGLGGPLLRLCTQAVRDAGMEALFVDTGPSVAHKVYEKHGFEDLIQDHPEWMGQAFTEHTIHEYLTEYYDVGSERFEVRSLDFSHAIEIRALINGSIDPACLVKNYLLGIFCDDQLHQGQIFVEVPNLSHGDRRKVHMLGLFAVTKLVGFSTLAPWRTTQWDNGREAHIGLVDLHVHPKLWRTGGPGLMFEAMRCLADEMGLLVLRTIETPRDTAKTDALIQLGFRVKFEMHDEVVLGEGQADRGRYPSVRMEDLAVYEMEIGRPKGFEHPYRKPWDY